MSAASPSYDCIMVPLDLSSYSEDTFAHALNLARAFKAELVILNVVNSRGLDALDQLAIQGMAPGSAAFIDKVKAERTSQFEREYLPRAEGIKTRVIFRVGLPYDEIVQAAGRENASVVVMGAKGRSNLAGALFGTTAEKVFRRCPCPVFSVRGPEHRRLG